VFLDWFGTYTRTHIYIEQHTDTEICRRIYIHTHIAAQYRHIAALYTHCCALCTHCCALQNETFEKFFSLHGLEGECEEGRAGRKAKGVCSKTTPCLDTFGEHVWRSNVDILNSLNELRSIRKRSEKKGVCSRMTGDRQLPC